MTEYETRKPALVAFDKIFEYIGQYGGSPVIMDALKKFDTYTILKALKGIDKHSRMLIMQCLPTKTTDEINYIIENSDKSYNDIIPLYQTRDAQKRILNAVNKMGDKYRQGKYGLELIKC
jgi:hypothetical protein